MIEKPKVLYVVGLCLYNNTSANMSHNAFIKGFIENSYEVDIIMPDNSWGARDNKLKKLNANYFEYQFYSYADRLRVKFSYANPQRNQKDERSIQAKENKVENKVIKNSLREFFKKCFYSIFKTDPRYGREVTWLKKAQNYYCEQEYDLVVSNSCPEASHKLVLLLTEKNRIKYRRWIQIWEDPWYYDLYGGHTLAEKEEEHFLLKRASEVYYVSPLTLMYQKKFYADCADKMKCVPLPFLEYEEQSAEKPIQGSFGYFGDYYSVTRNLIPFYNALKGSGYKGFIYGDNDLNLQSTEGIEVSGRVTLDILSGIQGKTEILVHLCNLKGGQIPGKIYHYSATTKPILFILDGTEDEKRELFNFFSKFDRYYFCENNEEDILSTMRKIINERKVFEPVKEFSPKEIVRKIIDEEEVVVH